jgi:hypothetical protein
MSLGMSTVLFASFALAASISRAQPTPGAADAAVAAAIGAALQADAARALRLLRQVPESELAPADRAFRACMLKRFDSETMEAESSDLPDAFARGALDLYRRYWRTALLRPEARPEAEATLLRELRRLLAQQDAADLDALEPALKDRLAQSGYHALLGVTLPLRELMLWTKQDTRAVKVELPEGAHTIEVVYLDGFVSLGWSYYATCGRRGTGGWATDKALYAVVPRYSDLEGEEFRVSFLGHETQHFADYGRFPGLEQWQLEYRAKLTELAYADTTRGAVLRKFTEDQGDDPRSPHAYADRRVLEALRQRLALPANAALDSVPVARVQAAAVAELRADSQRHARSP